MSEVLFYHLEQQTLEQALLLLLDATMKRLESRCAGGVGGARCGIGQPFMDF